MEHGKHKPMHKEKDMPHRKDMPAAKPGHKGPMRRGK